MWRLSIRSAFHHEDYRFMQYHLNCLINRIVLPIAISGLSCLAIWACKSEEKAHGTPGSDRVSMSIATPSNSVAIGSSFGITLSITNSSTSRLVFRNLNAIYQWLVVRRHDSSDVPSRLAWLRGPSDETYDCFVALKAGEGIACRVELSWVKDESLRRKIFADILPEEGVLEAFNQYLLIKPGKYKLSIKRAGYRPSSLRINDNWVSVEEYFQCPFFSKELVSNCLSVEFVGALEKR